MTKLELKSEDTILLSKFLKLLKKELKTKRLFERGLCRFSLNLLEYESITQEEYDRFDDIIYYFRERFCDEDHQRTLYFFHPGEIPPRIEFLEKILDLSIKEELGISR